ncbi:MAG TPA: conjugal transfer protein TraF [Nitrospiraceae bacterium]|nr:conjugal transfer protein TraF [Nitrospiraceae bacterium]
MSCNRSFRVAAIFIGLMLPAQAFALEFVTVGPRAMGMGGAGVAVTTDAFATYWNPAGLAMTQTVDIRIQGSGQAIDRYGIADALHDLENFNTADGSQANKTRADDIAARINRPGATVSVNGAAGLYLKGHLGEHAIGVNVSDVATGGGFVSTPVQATQPGGVGTPPINLAGAMTLPGFEARQVALSYAYAFSDKTFSFGVTGKIIQGASYRGTKTLTGGEEVSITGDFGRATTSMNFGIDLGAIYRPSSWLRFGMVAKDINRPTFDAHGGGELKLDPQIRGGIAVNPYSSLTLTADVDATSNKTLVPGVKSQVLSLGAEQTIFSEFMSFRLGAFKNMKDSGTPFIPTAGLGFRIFAFRLDIGGGYDFREQGALVSGSASLTF